MFTGGAVNTTGGAGVTVMVLETDASGRPQISVAVHVSVIVPPHGPGVALNVDGLDVPLNKHDPLRPFVYGSVPAVGVTPHAIVIPPGAVIVGNVAGVTVIILLPLIVLLHASVNVQLSVSVPPQPLAVPVLTAVTVPDIRQGPDEEFVYATVGSAGTRSQVTEIFTGGVVNTGTAAGVTVIVLETDTRGRPQISVAVHVSVIVPPHTPGAVLNVEVLDVPLIKQDPVKPLLYGSVPDDGTDPHAIVVPAGAVMVGNAAGVTVTVLLPLIVLLHASVNVQVSVSVPPQPLAVPLLTAVTVPDIKHVPDDEFV
jgi:hypothetical protein